MKIISSFLSLFCLFTLSKGDEEEAVYTLTSENFASFMGEHSKVLVEFYAPWCGHCKALAPEYEKAAQKLAADESIDAVLAKVDATEEKDLASKYGVRGFPTLKYFTGGDIEKPSDYTGGRTESTIVQWLSQRALPPITDLEDKDGLDSFKSKSRVVLVSYTPSDDVSKILLEFAEANRESVVVGRVTNNDLVSKLDDVNSGDLYVYKQFDDGSVKFTGKEVTLDTLNEFVNSERFPLIDAIGPENYKDYIDRGLPLVWIALEVTNEEQTESVLNLLKPYATEYKGKLSFTYVDNGKYAQHVSGLGISEVPGLMIVGDEKFLLKEALNEDSVSKFFSGYKAGTLEAHLKSEEVPEANDEDVFVLVGKSFKDVIGKEKDVFVEFYAPWCGHCKRLAPEYEKVGAAFKDVDNVVIAKIDATENDTPEEIKGFPTLIFYPKGQLKGEKYNGERTADAIVEFVKSKATVDVSNVKSEL
jgi:protein disulfide-isomerase A1